MFLRATGSMGAAALMTATLYYGMHLLIDAGGVPVWSEAPPDIIITIPEPKPDPEPIRDKKPELPEVVEQPKIAMDAPTIQKPGKAIYSGPKLIGSDSPKTFDPIATDRDAQPMYRQEPNFQNITRAEAITLAFDVRPNGSVDPDTITVLEATSKRLERPAMRAVRKWKYQGKIVNGEALWQRDVRVRFTVEPPR
ncbi:MAG: TonB family protein [Pseudomonadota bacterium]